MIVIQFVPYGRDHTNPPAIVEPNWDSAQTRALAERACFDCHSNETEWPVYARVAPASWLVHYDVTKGRAELNFSEWHRTQKEAREAPEVLREHEMPPLAYRLVHSRARLTPSERERLAEGLAKTLAGKP
jgi:mono/diheme cytochrome c family protein